MKELVYDLIALIMILVVITFFARHGMIDFSGVDTLFQFGKDAVESDTGQQIIGELKDITIEVTQDLLKETKDLIVRYKEDDKKVPVTLVSVVDGDTLIVNLNGENVKVRLIGIDTPESVHADAEKNNIYGEYASLYTASILTGVETVYLEFDEDTEDDYGRLLAYVWLSDGHSTTSDNIGSYMLNGILVKNGYAYDKKYEPNDKYQAAFAILRNSAKSSSAGLWGYDEFKALWE